MRHASAINRLVLCLTILVPCAAWAGGGPENVLLVVNPRSEASLTIANHYVHLRQIPPKNVIYVPWDPAVEQTDIEKFRKDILAPVLKAAIGPGNSGRIDYVVYSSDFPWGVNVNADVKAYLEMQKPSPLPSNVVEFHDPAAAAFSPVGEDPPKPDDKPSKPTWPKQLTQVGSINGLTYLWQAVQIRNPAAYMSLSANGYVRHATAAEDLESFAFHGTQHFGPRGELIDPRVVEETYRRLEEAIRRAGPDGKPAETITIPGLRYLLSTMLAVTAGRGNTVEEALACLTRSAAADGTRPGGTVYYVQNDNVRSQARHDLYPAAAKLLGTLGVSALVLHGDVPKDRPDVQGIMLGVASFDWKKSNSTILPGAICDHLTSFGGVMSAGAGQTPLSEFLRNGASGASGTVTEPFAIQAKFPLPWIHAHYARGHTLAEAFYQSVAGPYQLLIVGDPLCRPWARIPTVAVDGVEPGAVVSGTVDLTPWVKYDGAWPVDHFELFVDEVRHAVCGPDSTLRLNTRQFPDGYHELRVVAIEASGVETQGRCLVPLRISNRDRKITASATPSGEVPLGTRIEIAAECPEAIAVAVTHNTRLLGRINGPAGRIEIDTAELGKGPVRLSVVGMGRTGTASNAIAAPIDVVVK